MVDIAKLARICTAKKYHKDEIIFCQGDDGHEMYIILAGCVSVEINSEEGLLIQISQLKSGDFFGEMSLLEDESRSATIKALEYTVLLVITMANFENVIQDEPMFAYGIMKVLSQRIRRQNIEISAPETIQASTVASETTVMPIHVPVKTAVSTVWLFPAEHKKFQITEAGTPGDFLLDKKVLCPVCNTFIDVKLVRTSKLALQKVDPDFRQHIVNFEPLWYSIQVCSHCFYANLAEDFAKVNDRSKKIILEDYARLKAEVVTGFSTPRNIDEVFTAYYIAIHWLKRALIDKLKEGKLWLRLAWLYEDVGDQALSLMASEKALVAYKDVFHNSRRQTTVEQDQRLSMLLGELCMRNNLRNEARKYFHDTIVFKGGNRTLNEKAQDRMREIHVE
ncbi:MAG: DUF2225 domain-containing protein [Desulfitobacteriaceae bacterium]